MDNIPKWTRATFDGRRVARILFEDREVVLPATSRVEKDITWDGDKMRRIVETAVPLLDDDRLAQATGWPLADCTRILVEVKQRMTALESEPE